MMANTSNPKPRALVTGASSGLGQAFAERLARDGYDLTIVARRGDRLEELAKRLRADQRVDVSVVIADLGKSADLRALEKRIAEMDTLELLVNNAGFGGYMPFIQLEPDKAEELIQLKVLAVTRLTHAALPGMLARKKGIIINVSSRLAFSASVAMAQLPKRATYVGVNAFINAFTQLLQFELEGTGVQVQALCPGVVETEFHERVGIKPGSYPAAIVMQPQDVVQASLAGLRLGEVICMPPLEDASLLARIDEDQRQMFDASRTGALASRYKS
jgi:short-subunit dehydrogenase